eukprot:NODE_114_length_19305_cov_0.149849.p4 type:complete len:431 gc:universal NODE_114_length_19305_cov_0.149849:15116-16408(+)
METMSNFCNETGLRMQRNFEQSQLPSMPSVDAISFSESCFEIDSNSYCSFWSGTNIQKMVIGSFTINNNKQLEKYLDNFKNDTCQPYLNYYICNLISQNSNCGVNLCDSSCTTINDKLSSCDAGFKYSIDNCPKDKCLPLPIAQQEKSQHLNDLAIVAIVVFCCLPFLCLIVGCHSRNKRRARERYLSSKDPSPQQSKLVLRNVVSSNSMAHNIMNKISNASFLSSKKSAFQQQYETQRSFGDLNNEPDYTASLPKLKLGPTPIESHVVKSPMSGKLTWSDVTEYDSCGSPINKTRMVETADSAVDGLQSNKTSREFTTSAIQTDKSYLNDSKKYRQNVFLTNSVEIQTSASFLQKTSAMYLRGTKSLRNLLNLKFDDRNISGSNSDSADVFINIRDSHLSENSSTSDRFMEIANPDDLMTENDLDPYKV